jgi:hypothetical protein
MTSQPKTSNEIAASENISQRHARRLLSAGDPRAFREVAALTPAGESPNDVLKRMAEQTAGAFTNLRPLVLSVPRLKEIEPSLSTPDAAQLRRAVAAIERIGVALDQLVDAACVLNRSLNLIEK